MATTKDRAKRSARKRRAVADGPELAALRWLADLIDLAAERPQEFAAFVASMDWRRPAESLAYARAQLSAQLDICAVTGRTPPRVLAAVEHVRAGAPVKAAARRVRRVVGGGETSLELSDTNERSEIRRAADALIAKRRALRDLKTFALKLDTRSPSPRKSSR